MTIFHLFRRKHDLLRIKDFDKISLDLDFSQYYLLQVLNWGLRLLFTIFCTKRGGPYISIFKNPKGKNRNERYSMRHFHFCW